MASAATLDPNLLERVKTILRRDLKLGADAKIADDMGFFNSDVDLDSLDILLLVTSVEKEFGIKIPNEAVGREVFESVATLSRYIQEHGGASAKQSSARVDHLARLPHRDPFRFVTSLTNIRDGESAEGVWAITGMEPFFAGHFPNRPVVPGVLIAEALAQLSGLAGTAPGANEEGKLAQVDVRFEEPVVPPAQIVLKSKVTRVMGQLQMFEVSAHVGERTVARGSLTLHRTPTNAGMSR